ncbi:MAG: AtpZ/AtpI family protein [Ignavibacteriales bacterium]
MWCQGGHSGRLPAAGAGHPRRPGASRRRLRPPRTINVLHLGFIFVLNVMLFSAAGRWADRHWGTGGPFTAASTILGMESLRAS